VRASPDTFEKLKVADIKIREAQAKAYLAAQRRAREKSFEHNTPRSSTKDLTTDPDSSRMRIADIGGRNSGVLDGNSPVGTEMQGSGDRDGVSALRGGGHRSSSVEELPAAGPTQTQDPIIKQEFVPHFSLWNNSKGG
jgi:hypothetical protein